MRNSPAVSGLRFTRADAQLMARGLGGWVSFLLDGHVRIEGVTVRRTSSGRLVLSFPFREDGYGKRWHFVRPIDDATRVAIEKQVIAQLGEVVR